MGAINEIPLVLCGTSPSPRGRKISTLCHVGSSLQEFGFETHLEQRAYPNGNSVRSYRVLLGPFVSLDPAIIQVVVNL